MPQEADAKMREIANVLASANGPKAAQLEAKQGFLRKREEIWHSIQEGRFPATYVAANGKRFVGATRRTAIRCEFVLANKMVLGPKYHRDRIADMAQRDLLFLRAPGSRALPAPDRQQVLLLPAVHFEAARVREREGLSLHRQHKAEGGDRGR